MDEARRRKLTRNIIVVLFAVGALWLVVALDEVFGPLLLALLLAYILNPVVNWIVRATKLPRAASITVLFVAFYASLVAIVALTVPTFIAQVGQVYEAAVGEQVYTVEVREGAPDEASLRPAPRAGPERPLLKEGTHPDGTAVLYHDRNGNGRYDPGYLYYVTDWLNRMKGRLKEEPDLTTYPIGAEKVKEYIADTGERAVKATVNAVGNAIYTTIGFLTAFVLIPIYLFYFLMGLTAIRDRTFELLPGRYRDRIVSILKRIDEATSAFFKGRLIIMVIKGAMVAVALAIAGLPYALLLGVVTGVGSLVPLVGAVIGLIPGVAIALLDSQSVGLAISVAAIFIVIELFENYGLTPWILKDRVGLHPVTILVSVFAAGALFGFVGMLLSVPIASVAKILYTEFVLPQLRNLAEEKPAKGG